MGNLIYYYSRMESTLKGIIFFSVALAIVISTWWNTDYVIKDTVAEVCQPNIKDAIYKMGPGYDYRIWSDGTLQVNKGDGKWLRLRYERDKR